MEERAPGLIDQLVYKQSCTIERLVEIINEQQKTIEALKLPGIVGVSGPPPASSRSTMELAEQVAKWMDVEEGKFREAAERDQNLHIRLLDLERVAKFLMSQAGVNQDANGPLARPMPQQIG